MALALPKVTLISDATDLIDNVRIVPSITPTLSESGRSPVGDSQDRPTDTSPIGLQNQN